MTDEVITALAVIAPEQLRVIARTTAMHYKGCNKDVARIGRELDIDYLVEGGVRRAEGQVAINLQLIRVEDQTHLFAKRYVADGSDIFRTQGVIAQEIAEQMLGRGADTSSSTSLLTTLTFRVGSTCRSYAPRVSRKPNSTWKRRSRAIRSLRWLTTLSRSFTGT
jgi:hypothetical protein